MRRMWIIVAYVMFLALCDRLMSWLLSIEPAVSVFFGL